MFYHAPPDVAIKFNYEVHIATLRFHSFSYPIYSIYCQTPMLINFPVNFEAEKLLS